VKIPVYLRDTDTLVGHLDAELPNWPNQELYRFAPRTRAMSDSQGRPTVVARQPTKTATVVWRWQWVAGGPNKQAVLAVNDEVALINVPGFVLAGRE